MHERYEHPEILGIWSDANKLLLWQKTELAVIKANVKLGNFPESVYADIRRVWQKNPIDIIWWKKRDAEIHHDLNAFLDERLRWLETIYHEFVHRKITSYDTEEPALGQMIKDSIRLVEELIKEVLEILKTLARRYRFTMMNARTHGQEAELQSFGARVLTWFVELKTAYSILTDAKKRLRYSKISGAIGKYNGIDPELELEALKILGFKPFYGATQIMPRIIYAPIAQALSDIVQVLDKIAHDIRLGARSGRPIYREPFKKKQKGSSAMPHKKNPIRTENTKGMGRMAKGYAGMITDGIQTWEERSIEQSSVERVAWPDLFHVTLTALNTMKGVLSGLQVYPDNMLQEIYESRGVYASAEVKEFLKMQIRIFGLDYEDIYRIVQLACFNVFEVSLDRKKIREAIPGSFVEGKELFQKFKALPTEPVISIQEFIPRAELRPSSEVDIEPSRVEIYNEFLKDVFADPGILSKWNACFDPEHLLRNEAKLFVEILGK